MSNSLKQKLLAKINTEIVDSKNIFISRMTEEFLVLDRAARLSLSVSSINKIDLPELLFLKRAKSRSK